MKLGRRRNDRKGWAAIRHYANQLEIIANLWIAFLSSSSGWWLVAGSDGLVTRSLRGQLIGQQPLFQTNNPFTVFKLHCSAPGAHLCTACGGWSQLWCPHGMVARPRGLAVGSHRSWSTMTPPESPPAALLSPHTHTALCTPPPPHVTEHMDEGRWVQRYLKQIIIRKLQWQKQENCFFDINL